MTNSYYKQDYLLRPQHVFTIRKQITPTYIQFPNLHQYVSTCLILGDFQVGRVNVSRYVLNFGFLMKQKLLRLWRVTSWYDGSRFEGKYLTCEYDQYFFQLVVVVNINIYFNILFLLLYQESRLLSVSLRYLKV